ncbi:unnamed protein product [Brachionus calyciflorus]|uniref:Uncharacterized protein n=1 Tax=Brachionus calyciflorus TaxID=104777 RepID=A0A814LAR2_9BILA|nr:unnamed protein product [Brachionus calyciflorus]
MSNSTPLKRKKRLSRIINDTDEIGLESHKSKNSNTEKIKRKNYVEISDDESEETGIYSLIQFVSNPERFAVVSEKQVSFNKYDIKFTWPSLSR